MISYNDGSNDDDNIGSGYDYSCCCQGDNDNRIMQKTGRLSDRIFVAQFNLIFPP